MIPGVAPVVNVAAPEEAVVLAVGDDQLSQLPGLPHGLLHQQGGLDAPAVIGEAHHLWSHGFQVRQNFSFFPFGNGTVGIDGDAGVFSDGIQLGLKGLRAVGNRVQVGHGAHRGVAPPGRRPGAGKNGLLIRKTRLSEMHMHVTKAE